jgi:hypothetical protein
MGLLPLAKDAEGVVCATATAWFGSVTLRPGQCISFDLLMRIVQSREVRGPGPEELVLTLDFFSLQRSQALQTRLRTPLSECEFSDDGVDWRAVIVLCVYAYI